MRLLWHGLWVLFLTLLPQIGGLAWLAALVFRRRWLAFTVLYGVVSMTSAWFAARTGQVPLPCWGKTVRTQSPLYCLLNRHYVAPETASVIGNAADAVVVRYPGTLMLVLDGNFPALTGFTLLPHLSHHDGRKADLAFFHARDVAYLPGRTRSPVGYFAFEQGPTDCPARTLTLRWDLHWLQGTWPELPPDRDRMRTLIQVLSGDARIGKILLEPHLMQSWGVAHPKVRFQGCRAARHDDHVHIQL